MFTFDTTDAIFQPLTPQPTPRRASKVDWIDWMLRLAVVALLVWVGLR